MAVRRALALTAVAMLLAPLSVAQAADEISREKQVRLDEASKALTACTVAAASRNRATLTPENLDRVVIGACVEAHGEIVELARDLPTPVASRIMLSATLDALAAARRAVAD